MQCKTGNIGVAAGTGHRPMHGLDDVSSNREIAQRVLDARLQRPVPGRDLFGKAKALQLSNATNHQPPQLGIAARAAWPQIGDTCALVHGIA